MELFDAWLDTQSYPTENQAAEWLLAIDEAKNDYENCGHTWPDANDLVGREKIRKLTQKFLRSQKSKDFIYGEIVLACLFLVKCELTDQQMMVFNQQLSVKLLIVNDLTVKIIAEIMQENSSLNNNSSDSPHIRGRRVQWNRNVTFLCSQDEECLEDSYGYLVDT